MIREPDLAWVIDGASASTVAALRSVAKGATEIIVATDYDREGELIGEEALRILRGDALRRHPHDKPEKPARAATRKAAGRARPAPAPPPAPDGDGDGDEGAVRLKAAVPPAVVDRHHRARYSALTPDEVKRAFAKLDTLDFKLADAAHTRQDIDLIWGAVLTRFMSLASYRYGSDYLSIGRVQTPTLRLVVDRELERRAFVPVPYWEIKAELAGGRRRALHGRARARPLRGRRRSRGGARRRPDRLRRGDRLRHDAALPGAAAAVQHDGAHERRVGNRDRSLEGLKGGRVAVSRRPDQLPAHRQHGLSGVARPAGRAAHDLRSPASVAGRRRARRPGHAQADARQEAHHRPPADLPGRRAQDRAARRPGARLRPRRAALSGHPAAGRGDRGPAARRAPRQRAVRGARQPRRQARLSARLAALHRRPRTAAAAGGRRRRARPCWACASTPRRPSRRRATARAR